MGDEDLAKGILMVFLEDMPSKLAVLAQAQATGDTKALRMTGPLRASVGGKYRRRRRNSRRQPQMGIC